MLFILFAALSSVGVSVLLKRYAPTYILPVLVWNYFIATILCFLWFKPQFNQSIVWWLIVVCSILLPTIFYLLAQSLKYAGLVKTEIAQRLSVILSLCAAYFIFNDHFSDTKLLGIGLGVVAIGGLVFKKDKSSITTQGMLSLLCVWVGYATVDVLLKYNSSLGQNFATSLNLIFLGACIVTLMSTIIKKQPLFNQKTIGLGLGVGILNFLNIALYVIAHRFNAPSTVFLTMNLSVVILGTVVGIFYFKEKLTPLMGVSLVIALSAISFLV